MNTGMIPSRYAKALYEYAGEKSATERVYGEMQRLPGSFAAEPALLRALDNPVLTPEQKSGLVYNAAGGDPSDELKRFVELVLSHKRMQLLHRMALDYMALYRRAHNISTGELQTAVAVDETTEQAQGVDRLSHTRDRRTADTGAPRHSRRVYLRDELDAPGRERRDAAAGNPRAVHRPQQADCLNVSNACPGRPIIKIDYV